MKARFTCLTFAPERVEEVKKVYTAEIAPVISAYQGNKAALLLVPEQGTEQFISYTLWQTDEDLKAFESSDAYRQVIGKIKELAEKAEQKYYDVAQ